MTFGVMFHHFHNGFHKKSQGSISAIQLKKIIKYLKEKYEVLDAKEYLRKVERQNIKNNEICLTFDDCLKSQFDIASPILKKEKIKAFFFIYSDIFKKKSNDYLEIFRDFRNTKYKNIDHFYYNFFKLLKQEYFKEHKKFNKKFNKNYLKDNSFYSLSDRKYRFCRDKILKKKIFEKLMFKLMVKKKYNLKDARKKLYMSKSDINKLIKDNHVFGLHSDTHPTNIYNLSFYEQYRDYKKNYNFIKKNFNISPKSMSHPFGRYNNNTLKVLKKIGIRLGFLSNEVKKKKRTSLEIDRIDHTKLLNKIK